MKLTLAILEQEIQELKRENQRLSQQVDILNKAVGITGLWALPGKAALFLGTSPSNIRRIIRQAEEARALGKRYYPPKYGVHYRNEKDVNSERAVWKVNVVKFDEYLNIPPEQRNY